jgi:hypothetical protein
MGIFHKLYVLVACALVLLAVTGCHNIKNNNAISNNQQVYSSQSGYISVESGKLFGSGKL